MDRAKFSVAAQQTKGMKRAPKGCNAHCDPANKGRAELRRPTLRQHCAEHTAAARDDDSRWAAVVARDPAFDGAFYVCVATTGIYCRNTCVARLPLRANVRFVDTIEQAEAAGFRACKRCKPGAPSLMEQHSATISAACREIETAFAEPRLGDLAHTAGLSPHHFHRVFKAVTGLTPKAYASAHRRVRIRDALPASASVTAAIYEAGFNSSARFYAGAQAALGMSPATFRAGGKGEHISYALGRCSLGAILVAASAQGICAILLGDDPHALIDDLAARFPKATLTPGDAAFAARLDQVIAFVDAPATSLDLPLDIRGTVFQHKVWQALRDIPPGETLSYAQLAQRIGQPAAVRAVASACAANSLAVAIPCHRIVKSDGKLSGYRWGVDRKRALLEREAAPQPKRKTGI